MERHHFLLAMPSTTELLLLMLFVCELQSDRHPPAPTRPWRPHGQRFLVGGQIWRHAGRTGISYSDHYEEKGLFQRLMDRLRRIAPRGPGFAPVMALLSPE